MLKFLNMILSFFNSFQPLVILLRKKKNFSKIDLLIEHQELSPNLHLFIPSWKCQLECVLKKEEISALTPHLHKTTVIELENIMFARKWNPAVKTVLTTSTPDLLRARTLFYELPELIDSNCYDETFSLFFLLFN